MSTTDKHIKLPEEASKKKPPGSTWAQHTLQHMVCFRISLNWMVKGSFLQNRLWDISTVHLKRSLSASLIPDHTSYRPFELLLCPHQQHGLAYDLREIAGHSNTKRVDYLRVIIMELAQIADHLICNSVIGVDTGAFTGFLYVMQYRELIYEIWEEVCGSRLTTNIGRIGGFERDFNDIAFTKLEKFLKEYPVVLREFENLFVRNRIFYGAYIGTGPISAERALNYGFTGPIFVQPVLTMMYAYIHLTAATRILNLIYQPAKPVIPTTGSL
jgi:hypothetical protein